MERSEQDLRALPPPPALVFDVGGGTGHYAAWLARRGYSVHLIDAVPLHIEQAAARSAEQPEAPLASITLGDARHLEWSDAQIDAVLLLGPLHFTTAYLHHPENIESEIGEAGFTAVRVVAVEGPGWLLQDFEVQWTDPGLQEVILEVVRRTEAERSLLGASSHLMAMARKPGD